MYDSHKPHAERRRHPRMRMKATLDCICLDPGAVDVVNTLRTIDISRSGLGALSSRAFYPGEKVVVRLPMADGTGQRDVYATVVRSRYDRDEQAYRVGLEFDGGAVGARQGLEVTTHAAA